MPVATNCMKSFRDKAAYRFLDGVGTGQIAACALLGSLKQPHDRATKVLPARARPLERLRDELMRSRSPSGDTRGTCRRVPGITLALAVPIGRNGCQGVRTDTDSCCALCGLGDLLCSLRARGLALGLLEGGKRALNCGFRVLTMQVSRARRVNVGRKTF